MKSSRPKSMLAASIVLCALAGAGCGSSSKSSSASTTSSTSATTAPTTTTAKTTTAKTTAKHTATTATHSGTKTRSSAGPGLPTLATTPHLGDACNVKDETAYVVAGFTCLKGHLTSAGHSGLGSVYKAGQFCKRGSEALYNAFHLTCAKGKLVKQ